MTKVRFNFVPNNDQELKDTACVLENFNLVQSLKKKNMIGWVELLNFFVQRNPIFFIRINKFLDFNEAHVGLVEEGLLLSKIEKQKSKKAKKSK
jgi:hypothetical protein